MKLQRLLAASVAIAVSATAWAHAFLDHAEPKVGSVVATAPGELRIWFTQVLEPAFSTADVVDAQGKRVNAARPEVDAKDRTLMHVPLAPLAPGEYAVSWRVVSVDTHVTQGRFTFRVGS